MTLTKPISCLALLSCLLCLWPQCFTVRWEKLKQKNQRNILETTVYLNICKDIKIKKFQFIFYYFLLIKKILSQMVAFVIVWTPYAICYMWPLFSDVKNMSVRFDALAPVVSKLSVLTTPLLLLSDMDSSKNKSKINKSN